MPHGAAEGPVHIIPIPELPNHLTEEAHAAIRSHSVSLVATNENELEGIPCGGTFVRVAGRVGILTARHVWELIRSRTTLILLVGSRPYRVPTRELTALGPAGDMDLSLNDYAARVPDIALICLAHTHVTRIEANGKCFYSIDRRTENEGFDVFGLDGFWVVIGSPLVLLDVERRAVPSLLYETDIDRIFVQGDWDYAVINLNVEGNPAIPNEFGGMSGGGLWRARFRATEDRSRFWFEDITRDIVLSGVTFFQTALDGRQLIAHGPRSVYQSLPTALR